MTGGGSTDTPMIATSFDRIAADYERMIDWSQRLAREVPLINTLLRSRHVESLIDFGCGPGRHAIEFKKLGYRVAGVDRSREMLAIARANAGGMDIRFAESLRDLTGTYDAVMSIGNTIVSLTTAAELAATFKAMRRRTNAGGVLLLQVRNYQLLSPDDVVTLGLRETPESTYFRAHHLATASRRARYVHLHTFKLGRLEGKSRVEGTITRVRGWSRSELKELLARAGYRQIAFYSDYALSKYTPQSIDLIVLARR